MAKAASLYGLQAHLLLMQEDQALGHIQRHPGPLLVPAEPTRAVGVAVLQDAGLQVASLHVLQHQHGAGRVQASAVELDHIAVIGQLVHQVDLLP